MSMDAVAEPDGIDELPALVDARRRVLDLAAGPHTAEELAAAVEFDLALLIRVLRAANALEGRAGTVASAAQAVILLGSETVMEIVEGTPSQELLSDAGAWGLAPQRYRAHIAAVRAVAEYIARDTDSGDHGEMTAAIVLHDVGRLALAKAEPAYDRLVDPEDPPEHRLRAERGALGIDHAELGGWLARRWGFPERLATAIEHHHGEKLGLSAVVRLADMLVHAREGRSVDLSQLTNAVAVAGVPPSTIRAVAFA